MEISAVEFVVKFNHEVLFSSCQAQMFKKSYTKFIYHIPIILLHPLKIKLYVFGGNRDMSNGCWLFHSVQWIRNRVASSETPPVYSIRAVLQQETG